MNQLEIIFIALTAGLVSSLLACALFEMLARLRCTFCKRLTLRRVEVDRCRYTVCSRCTRP